MIWAAVCIISLILIALLIWIIGDRYSGANSRRHSMDYVQNEEQLKANTMVSSSSD
ncbi:hypothetical protein JOC77_000467 [Peribacillus deserti]|uniref:YtzI protein n=1 Tax=Peribacillus deserti TaxID=673318 RepID=A0ABS2QD95_9BACI|nr:hypothetical protein [Peribacillus deserti]MBM7691062.1 hypothetical protein [Peribacillus deserti]